MNPARVKVPKVDIDTTGRCTRQMGIVFLRTQPILNAGRQLFRVFTSERIHVPACANEPKRLFSRNLRSDLQSRSGHNRLTWPRNNPFTMELVEAPAKRCCWHTRYNYITMACPSPSSASS